MSWFVFHLVVCLPPRKKFLSFARRQKATSTYDLPFAVGLVATKQSPQLLKIKGEKQKTDEKELENLRALWKQH